ncbi:hypothetical protein [Nocardioides sp. SYSU DS0663]|uniref:hypothetical protein n=1 Tax=Nocardioides sp. SYSU DS0663 TaxID=3416445 RepID=UPI003F4BAA60
MSTATFESRPGEGDLAASALALPPVRTLVHGRLGSDGATGRGRGLVPALVALLAAQSVVVLDLDVPVLRAAIALVTMLVLPAWILHRRASWPSDSAAARGAYALGASVLALMLVGLAVNTVGLALGADRVLTAPVLGTTWLVLDAALLAWRPWVPLVAPVDPRAVARRVWAARVEPAQALAVVALPLAVLGAVRLNNDGGGGLALVAHLLVVAAYAVLLLRPGTVGRDIRVLYLTGLALLLATSLRGWGVTGHDVQAEYGVYRLTASAQHWSMDLLENAYTACLSITILPVVLAETTGLSGESWFKVGLQAGFAVVPVVAYLAFRRLVPTRLALVATAFLVAFPTFHVDMPYLVRQEVAFLFLALLLLAATDGAMPVRTRRVMVVVFGVGVVTSHYTTTYLLLMSLFGALVLLGVAMLADRVRGRVRHGGPLVLLHPVGVLLVAASSLLWTGPVTDTGGHPLTVAQEAIESAFDGEDDAGSNDRRFLILGGQEETARERLDRFVSDTMEAREAYPRRLATFQKPGPALTEPEILPEDEAPLTPVGELVEAAGIDAGAVVGGLRNGSAALMQVLLLAGVWWVTRAGLRRLGAPAAQAASEDSRQTGGPREDRVTLEMVCLVLGVMAALGLVVVVPSLSVEYGVLRAFLQSMLFVAPVAAVGLWWVAGRLPGRRRGWLVAVPIALLAVLTSAGTALVGGGPAKLALANAGIYYERYIVEDSDEAAVEWIAAAPDRKGPLPTVLAPTSQVVRLATAGVPLEEVHGRTFPTVLNRGSYLFADSRMTGDREDTLFLEGDRVTYRYPLRQVGGALDLVYSAGESRLYR